jgi:hypothetical protein
MLSAKDIITSIFIHCLCDIILCKMNFDKDALKKWETRKVILSGEIDPDEIDHYDFHLVKMVLASAQAKPTGNPDNIRALLIYEISHVNLGEVKGEKCHRCGLPVDKKRREGMRKRIKGGYRLKDLKGFDDCLGFIGTHLKEEEIWEFISDDEPREVHFAAQRKRVAHYFQQIQDC